MNIDADIVSRWRAETPGCATRIHLNNAGASLMPAVVKEAITAHLGRESLEGGYEAADGAATAIAEVYADLARLVGAKPGEIAIAPSATHAFALALSAFDFAKGDVILTSSDDYVSNQLMYLSLAKRLGVRVVRAPDAPEGGVDVEAFGRLLRTERPRLAALTWVPTNSGLVQPAAAIGAKCRAAGVPYLLDACQALGQIPIDVDELGCDYLSTTARKFLRGPRGIGFLVVRESAMARGDFPLLVDMRGARWTSDDAFELVEDARRFEAWEFSHALILGLGAAARYAMEVGVLRAGQRAARLAAHARERLTAIPGVRSLDRGRELCAIATFAVEGHVGRDLVLALREEGINTSSQSRGDALIDLTRKHADSLIRVSPHYYNTEAEIDTAARALARLLGA